VEGSEVEWTLGFALAEIDFRPHREKIVFVDHKTWKYFFNATIREMFAPVKLFLWIMRSSFLLAHSVAIGFWKVLYQENFSPKLVTSTA
jgi:hypothetical protein